MILQLNPTLWLKTPIGVGLAHFLIDYGEEHDLLWVVADDATGEIWAWPNPEVRLVPNISLGAVRINDVAKKHPGFKAVQAKIAKEEGVSEKAAGAILAKKTRNVSAAAKAKNPRLKRVK